MSLQLLTDYPWYFIVFCLLLGGGAAAFTYWKSSLGKGKGRFSWPIWLLASLRFLSISFLSFLLLAPVVKSVFKKVERPIVALALDRSQSVLLNKDSAYYKKELPQAVEKLRAALGERYDVRTFSFGGDVKENLDFAYTEKQTDLSRLYDEIYNRFYNQNLGAVITLTDGIYNQGQSPLLTAERLNAPLFNVALGDTVAPRDLVIRDVRYNSIAYTGNLFPVQVQFRGKGYKGQNVQVSISSGGATLWKQNVTLSSDNHFEELEAKLEAKAPGLQRFRVEVTRLDGEISHVNNRYDIFIDVLESKRRILMVAGAPHPDMGALKTSIERNQYYEVSSYTLPDFQRAIGLNAAKLKNFQLVILHGLPGVGAGAGPFLKMLQEEEIPVLYVLSGNSDLIQFANLDAGVSIQQGGARSNESLGSLNPQFSLFTFSEDLPGLLPQLPPLLCPFGDYKTSDKQGIALYQQIGKVRTDMPLLVFGKSGRQKTGILCGEGIWRWFLYEYSLNSSFRAMDELVSKSVQYLSVRTDTRPFRARPTRNSFNEDERVNFEAELYNQSFEPVKDAAVKLVLRDEKGKTFDYTFQPRGNGYFLDAGLLPAGVYTYRAETQQGGKTHRLGGELIVKAVELEYLETTANHRLLHQLSAQSGGKVVYPRQVESLAALLQSREDLQPVAYMQTDFRELIHFKWLFGLCLVLLGVEWFLRRYFGGY